MVCHRCTNPGKEIIVGKYLGDNVYGPKGEWLSRIIDNKRRMVCRTCGYIDPRDGWSGTPSVYHGPKDVDPRREDRLNYVPNEPITSRVSLWLKRLIHRRGIL